jgi:hypothetical protein
MKKMTKASIWPAPALALAAALALTTPGPAAAAAPTAASAYATFPGRLSGVTAISARDAWAVGLSPGGSLIVHWNGTAWSQSLIGAGYLPGVAASSARDVWAVGGTNWFSPTYTLAEHWDGSSWTHVPTPSPAGGGRLQAVAATSPTNAWAVGLAGPGPGGTGPSAPLVEHWDGMHWSIQQDQAPAEGGQFSGISATSPDDAWAVGQAGPNGGNTGQQTLIEHWNGMHWIRVPSPNLPGSSATSLSGVTAISSHDAWAVGYANVRGSEQPVDEHWNGSHWSLVPSPALPGGGLLLGVGSSGAGNVWAVGQAGNASPYQTITERWGCTCKHWKRIPSPNPPGAYLNALFGVSMTSSTDVWAVGATDYESTLILHWNGRSWT